MGEIAKKRIEQLRPVRFASDEGSRFCLDGVWDFDPEGDARLEQKRLELLEGVEGWKEDGEQGIFKCTIGGCDRQITGDPLTHSKEPTERTGICKAASYCLKRAFNEVGDTLTVGGGRALYREIMDTCEGARDSHNAGNRCPRLDCGLSAGLSVDQVAGTVGKCVCECKEQL